MFWKNYSKFINLVKNFLSDNSIEGTPVPISNTEVKLNHADNSYAKIGRR